MVLVSRYIYSFFFVLDFLLEFIIIVFIVLDCYGDCIYYNFLIFYLYYMKIIIFLIV